MKYLSNSPFKTNLNFRDSSRRDDANLVRAAFHGRSQQDIADKASRALGVTDRQIINWITLKHDMPSWAVKATKHYVRSVERIANRIEG